MSASLDKRRINGPDRLHQPVFRDSAAASSGSSSKPAQTRNVDEGRMGQSSRKDSDSELRPLYIQTSLISQATGSCYIECSSSPSTSSSSSSASDRSIKLACAVYGPRQPSIGASAGGSGGRAGFADKAELNVECRYAPFAVVGGAAGAGGQGGRVKPGKNLDSSILSSRIRSALLPCVRLDLLPKAAIDIYISVLDAGGSGGSAGSGAGGIGSAAAAEAAALESCAALGVTAASAALALAGVDMWGLAVGVVASVQSSASSPSLPRVLVDPTPLEAAAAASAASSASSSSALVSLATMPALGSVISLDTTTTGGKSGGLGLEDIDAAVQALEAAAAKVHLVVAEALQEDVRKRAASVGR